MLSHLLCQAQEFERNHGIAPNVMYVNPMHFEALFREYPELFEKPARRSGWDSG